MDKLHFTKMHGLGNDFVIIETISQSVDINKHLVSKWANRHLGIGFDQLLLVGSSDDADFSCRIFNADGSEAEHCGNGLRCVARFLREKGLTNKEHITVKTRAGHIPIFIHDYDYVCVEMGVPLLNVSLQDQAREIFCVSLGNPHALLRVNDSASVDLLTLGDYFNRHTYFPQGVNVGVMQVLGPRQLRLRTYERGVNGEVSACGSNACAAAVTAIYHQWVNSPVTVDLQGGKLQIEWAGESKPVMMTGSATYVFDGVICKLSS